jgi:hypothetical protein
MYKGGTVKSVPISSLSVGLLAGALLAGAHAGRQNLLFILTDDQRANSVGAINPRVHTPNMDRLAKAGVK